MKYPRAWWAGSNSASTIALILWGVAAHTLRKIPIDHGRSHHAAKRNYGSEKISLDAAGDVILQRPSLIIAVDDALTTLEQQDPSWRA